MKKSKVIIPALGMIAFATAASITGTVAWFSANNQVSVSGMSFTTKVSNSILIAGDTTESVAKAAESSFTSDDLTQTKSGILEPVSTVDGLNFFYTVDAKADGDAKEDAYTAYTTQAAFATAYGQTGNTNVVPYLDYAFQLKVVNMGASAVDLKLTELTLKYSKATDGNVAYRVAIFVQDITSATPTAPSATAAGIYAPATAANQSDASSKNFAVSAADAAPTQLLVSGNAYNGLTKLASVPVASSAAASYYKVVARMYLEGEDTTCKSDTFAQLDGSWALGLKVELGGSNSNVSALTMDVTTGA